MILLFQIFYIDVGITSPNDIPDYMEHVKSSLKLDNEIQKNIEESNILKIDYFIPIRNSDTHIDIKCYNTDSDNIENINCLMQELSIKLSQSLIENTRKKESIWQKLKKSMISLISFMKNHNQE